MGKGSAKAVAIIPARMGSTRFPGKALASETGRPLVVHVCERAAGAGSIGRVVVATDSQEIRSAVESHGFEAVMTGAHPNGTSRLAEAAEVLGLEASRIVVNVQGDEPEIEGGVIDGAVAALCAERIDPRFPDAGRVGAHVGTVMSRIADPGSFTDPNVVKVVSGLVEPDDAIARVLYFSRAGVPMDRDGVGGVVAYRHVGIYAYRVADLRTYMTLGETPLERAERLEQLRWLEHGYAIAAAVRESSHTGIDTPEQYAAFVARRGAG